MNGLELIKHTAGGGVMTATTTGGSVELVKNGKIEFTNATGVHIDKCFDSTYDNYLVVMSGNLSTAENLFGRLRSSGADNTSSSYAWQTLEASGTNVAGGRTTGANHSLFGTFHPLANGSHYYFYGPALDQPTALRTVSALSAGNAYLYDMAITHSQSASFDGFTAYIANPITGSLTVYGFTKQSVV